MTRKKKWLIYGGIGLVLAAVVVLLGWRYLPWHKLMKRPTTDEIAFLNKPQGPGSGPYSISLDFEVDPKAGIPGDIYQGIAHSGNFSTRTFGKNTFSVMYEKTVRDLNVPDMKAVALSAWVYVFPSSGEPEGSLVFTVTNTVGVNTCWKGVSLHGPMVPREQWFKISGSFSLTDVQIRPDDKIQVYFWNNSDTKVLSDDFYIVFGAQAPRKGDSAMTDMTRGYNPTLNIPPFPVFFLHQEQTLNGNETTLDITPNDRVLTGRFTDSGDGLESIFVIKPDGAPGLFHYCPEQGFRKIQVTCPESLKKDLAGAVPLRGSFTSPNKDEILFVGEKTLILAGFGQPGGPCKMAGTELKVLWRSDPASINGVAVRTPGSLVPCDVNADRITELLMIAGQGSWQLFRFASDTWVSLVSGTENKLGEWDDKYVDYTVTAGHFLPGGSQDQLLTVFTEKSKKRFSYSLVKYLPGERKFVKALPAREGNIGLTVGHDTLKPGDQFFFGSFNPGENPGFLRYNRDWRFDLKAMQFNDSAFVIKGDIDFTGYEKDYNPKFYEALKLVPGKLISPTVTSILVIARNCKDPDYKGCNCREWEDLPYLPGTSRIYSFTSKPKP